MSSGHFGRAQWPRGEEQRSRGSAWWSRSRGLPRAVYDSWRSSLAAQPDRPARILAWARTSTGFCIASPATLSYGDEEGWRHVGWHEIERGSWNAELAQVELGASRSAGPAIAPRLARAGRAGAVAGAFPGAHFGNDCY